MQLLIAFCLFFVAVFQVNAKPPELLPDVLPEQVYMPLVNVGFQKTGPSIVEGDGFNHYRWELKAGDILKVGYKFYVKLWGTDYNNLYSIYVNAWQSPSQTTAKEQLKSVMEVVSRLDYSNSTPHQAADWVIAHINDKSAKKTFSGVEYSISRTNNSWQLIIAMPKPKSERRYFLP